MFYAASAYALQLTLTWFYIQTAIIYRLMDRGTWQLSPRRN
jgi:hypothetical protein